MSRTILPPQAYTSETLKEAYEWLRNQPQFVHEQAGDVDTLVYMYMKAKRQGKTTFQSNYGETLADAAPVSAQHFKSDLKNLAEGIRKFDFGENSPIIPPPAEPNTPAVTHSNISSPTQNTITQPPQHPAENDRAFKARVTERIVEVNEPTPPQARTTLDTVSQSKVDEVKAGLNLSSDQEAIRILISVGFEQILKVLPKL